MPNVRTFFLLSTASALSVNGAVNQATSNACTAVSKVIPGMVYLQGSKAYKDESANYWSQAMKDTKPACIAMPITSEGVSAVVKILHAQPTVKFAVKSGGHSPNADLAVVQDGVLLSPGGHWKNVIEDLAPYNKAVVGGRLDIVGVGGYLMGGGLSFLSAQYGMAADSVVNFETVMANGSVVHVNAQAHPDLLVAMRGGGNQFGIVVNFTMKTIPIGTEGKVWGGPIVFTDINRDVLLDAFHDFTENPVDAKAAVILTFERWEALHSKPPPGAFKKFEQIKNVPGLDFGATRTYGELLAINAKGGDALVYGRMNFRMMTLPLLPGLGGVNSMKEVTSTWFNETKKFQDKNFVSAASLALQSFPSLIGKATARTEGNAMGLSATDGPRWMVELTYVHNAKAADSQVWEAGRAIVSKVSKQMNRSIARMRALGGPATGKIEDYNPPFLNDAAFDQDVCSSYRDSEKFQALQAQVDPDELWRRTGGFKFQKGSL